MFKNKILAQGFIDVNTDDSIRLYEKYQNGFFIGSGEDLVSIIESEMEIEYEQSKNHDEDEFDYYGGISLYLDKAKISFYISDQKIDLEEVSIKYTQQLLGSLDIYGENYGYSEWTIIGFSLSNFTIGNHDLNEILKQYEGKYINFILEY